MYTILCMYIYQTELAESVLTLMGGVNCSGDLEKITFEFY